MYLFCNFNGVTNIQVVTVQAVTNILQLSPIHPSIHHKHCVR